MTSEVEVNPFRPGGELSKEAEDIIKHSTILRDTVIINDPSLQRANGRPKVGISTVNGTTGEKNPVKQTPQGDLQTSPKVQSSSNGPTKPDSSSTPTAATESVGPITCEVTARTVPALKPSSECQEQKVEHVRIKPGRTPGKCCVIQ
ncbi:unnamed protein product [Calicophoron daubneyi]|uniref:Uncharacterized protein n=1 Tax=Calicophoron daubneyi TaxID=300641 RepID=A0AAV2T8U9_CALDB